MYSALAFRTHTNGRRKTYLHSLQSLPLPVPPPSCTTLLAHQHCNILRRRRTERDIPFCDVRPQQIPRTQLRDIIFLSHSRTERTLPRTGLPEEEHAKWAPCRRSEGRCRRRRFWRRTRKPRLGGLGRARDSTAVYFRERSVEVQLQVVGRSTKLTSWGLHLGWADFVERVRGECKRSEQEATK